MMVDYLVDLDLDEHFQFFDGRLDGMIPFCEYIMSQEYAYYVPAFTSLHRIGIGRKKDYIIMSFVPDGNWYCFKYVKVGRRSEVYYKGDCSGIDNAKQIIDDLVEYFMKRHKRLVRKPDKWIKSGKSSRL